MDSLPIEEGQMEDVIRIIRYGLKYCPAAASDGSTKKMLTKWADNQEAEIHEREHGRTIVSEVVEQSEAY